MRERTGTKMKRQRAHGIEGDLGVDTVLDCIQLQVEIYVIISTASPHEAFHVQGKNRPQSITSVLCNCESKHDFQE